MTTILHASNAMFIESVRPSAPSRWETDRGRGYQRLEFIDRQTLPGEFQVQQRISASCALLLYVPFTMDAALPIFTAASSIWPAFSSGDTCRGK